MELLQKELTDKLIAGYYDVYNTLGYGFLEKVYQNSLYIELISRGFEVEAQKQIDVYYKDAIVGKYFADLIVNNLVVIEIKAAEALAPAHECQLINYLKATEIEVGLLFNFGPEPTFKRKVFSNERKQHVAPR